jgi:hypothetical protein
MRRFFERIGQVFAGNEATKAPAEEPELELEQMTVTLDSKLDPETEAKLRKNIEAQNAYYYQWGLKLDSKVKLTRKDGTSFVGTVKKIYAEPPYNPKEDFLLQIHDETNHAEEINILAIESKEVVITQINE